MMFGVLVLAAFSSKQFEVIVSAVALYFGVPLQKTAAAIGLARPALSGASAHQWESCDRY
jgi:hypothetical protein